MHYFMISRPYFFLDLVEHIANIVFKLVVIKIHFLTMNKVNVGFVQ